MKSFRDLNREELYDNLLESIENPVVRLDERFDPTPEQKEFIDEVGKRYTDRLSEAAAMADLRVSGENQGRGDNDETVEIDYQDIWDEVAKEWKKRGRKVPF